MNALEFLDAIAKKVNNKYTEKLNYGDPLETHGKSFIPVTKTVWRTEKSNLQESKENSDTGETIQAEPVGFLEVTKAGTRFIPMRKSNTLLLIVSIGFAAGFTLASLLHNSSKR